MNILDLYLKIAEISTDVMSAYVIASVILYYCVVSSVIGLMQ